MENKNFEIDWKILAVELDGKVDLETDGLKQHGLKELNVIGISKSIAEETAIKINTIAKMMIQGEEFDSSVCHCIDDSNGKTQFKFTLSSTPFFGKDTWVLNFI